MSIWLFAAKRGLLVYIKLVLLLSTSMVDSLVMASMLQQAQQSIVIKYQNRSMNSTNFGFAESSKLGDRSQLIVSP